MVVVGIGRALVGVLTMNERSAAAKRADNAEVFVADAQRSGDGSAHDDELEGRAFGVDRGGRRVASFNLGEVEVFQRDGLAGVG